MEKDFDKEIDAILRDVAKGNNFANSPKNHLDADEISLFAENALTINSRSKAVEHFADCNQCRSILVDVVSFKEEPTTVSKVILVETKTSFGESLRKLFSFKQLAFSMGALSLLFAGIIGFIAFNNNKNSGESLAQVEEMTKSTTAPQTNKSAISDEASKEVAKTVAPANVLSNATSTTAVANTSVNTSVSLRPNNQVSELQRERETKKSNGPFSKEESTESATDDKVSAVSPEPQSNIMPSQAAQSPKPVSAEKSVVEQPSEKVDQSQDSEVTRSAPALSKRKTAPNKPVLGVSDESDATISSNTKSVSGKTFRKSNGLWTDSAYSGGSTKDISKTSKAFNKLDLSLRDIANNFTEPVIVVWKAKSYKIQ
jgi:hypothetical protein